MANVTIDPTTVVDNPSKERVDFVGEYDGTEFDFAITYRALAELMAGEESGDMVDDFNTRGTLIASIAAEAAPNDDDVTIIDEDALGGE